VRYRKSGDLFVLGRCLKSQSRLALSVLDNLFLSRFGAVITEFIGVIPDLST